MYPITLYVYIEQKQTPPTHQVNNDFVQVCNMSSKVIQAGSAVEREAV